MRRLSKFALALLIGTTGGAILNWFGLPLAWMLGAMSACTVAALSKAPIEPLPRVQPFMTAVIGVLLGAGFTPDLLRAMTGWLPSLAGLTVFVLISAFFGSLYFRLVGRFDLTTAIFSAMPGGLVEMTTLGQERGGDAKLIALIHSARVLLVVFSLPYVVYLATGSSVRTASATSRASIFDVPLYSQFALLLLILAGMFLGHLLKLPARFLLGPMLLSGVLHASGFTKLQPPGEIVVVAQIVLGTLVGCRFAGTSPLLVLRILLLSVGSVAMLLLLAIIAAESLSFTMGYDPLALLLAYSPGGLTEMSLIALSMQVEVAFVSAHHVARMLMVVTTATILFRVARKTIPKQTNTPGPDHGIRPDGFERTGDSDRRPPTNNH